MNFTLLRASSQPESPLERARLDDEGEDEEWAQGPVHTRLICPTVPWRSTAVHKTIFVGLPRTTARAQLTEARAVIKQI